MISKFEAQLIQAYIDNQDNGVKAVEHALQDVIEKKYPNKMWWQVCNVSIFNELISGKRPIDLINKIVANCKEV